MNLEKSFTRRLTKTIAATAKRLLPEPVMREMRRYRAFEKHERSLYLKMRITNELGLTNPKPSQLPKKTRSILFVCFGNIMRSPMCEALLKKELASIENTRVTVTSAGLNAIPGRPAHPWAVTAAKEFDISLENHCARLLTSEMVSQADVIFAMDFDNHVHLLSRWIHAKKKVFLLGAYAGTDHQSLEISDPYYLGLEGTRRCYCILDDCIQNLARGLRNQGQTSARGDDLVQSSQAKSDRS